MQISRLTVVGLVLVSTGCATGIPKDALQLSPQSLQDRQMQTRRFDTTDEIKMLQACAALLQDLGFTLEESELDLGVLVASKQRTAVESGEVAAAVFLTIIGGVPVPYNERQTLRASIVTRPHGASRDQIAVRVTFQRIVWNTEKVVTIREGIKDPVQYQEFFYKLSEAVFLEAHQL